MSGGHLFQGEGYRCVQRVADNGEHTSEGAYRPVKALERR